MRKAKRQSTDNFDDTDLFSDQDLDLSDFIDSMETETKKRKRSSKGERARKQRLDAWREEKWLRDQLQDWGDWDKD